MEPFPPGFRVQDGVGFREWCPGRTHRDEFRGAVDLEGNAPEIERGQAGAVRQKLLQHFRLRPHRPCQGHTQALVTRGPAFDTLKSIRLPGKDDSN